MDINDFGVGSGKMLRTNNTVANAADGIRDDGSRVVTGGFLDLGLIIDAGVIAAGATVFSATFNNLSWVRNILAFIQADQLIKYSVFREISLGSGIYDWGMSMFTLSSTSSSLWQPYVNISVAGASSSSVLGSSAKFAFVNVTASPTTVARLRIQLLGQ